VRRICLNFRPTGYNGAERSLMCRAGGFMNVIISAVGTEVGRRIINSAVSVNKIPPTRTGLLNIFPSVLQPVSYINFEKYS
jgi:hypothetical protein